MKVYLICGDCGCRGFRLEEAHCAVEPEIDFDLRDVILIGNCPYCRKSGRISIKTLIRAGEEDGEPNVAPDPAVPELQ